MKQTPSLRSTETRHLRVATGRLDFDGEEIPTWCCRGRVTQPHPHARSRSTTERCLAAPNPQHVRLFIRARVINAYPTWGSVLLGT
jgi:hypothetical protein